MFPLMSEEIAWANVTKAEPVAYFGSVSSILLVVIAAVRAVTMFLYTPRAWVSASAVGSGVDGAVEEEAVVAGTVDEALLDDGGAGFDELPQPPAKTKSPAQVVAAASL